MVLPVNSHRPAVQQHVNTTQAIVVLGSTGSIGTSSLDVIRSHPERMRLVGAMANRSADALTRQAVEFTPDWALLADPQTPIDGAAFPAGTRLYHGDESLESLIRCPEVDTVVSAVVGAAGLHSTWVAVDAGKRVAIANKESLVVAGPIIQQRRSETAAQIFPVDSEHSAIFQALEAGRKQDLRRIILTASGGPFRGWTREQMKDVTPEMALKHPTWQMGPQNHGRFRHDDEQSAGNH